MSYLQTLFTEVYFKDIMERYDIGLPDVLAELTDALCSSVGSLTNVNKIKNTLQTVKNIQVSNTTLSNYLSICPSHFCSAMPRDMMSRVKSISSIRQNTTVRI